MQHKRYRYFELFVSQYLVNDPVSILLFAIYMLHKDFTKAFPHQSTIAGEMGNDIRPHGVGSIYTVQYLTKIKIR